ncbi:MAG TPA: glutamate--cysteine ligase [Spirillospora sp.]|nr:glutamate--cysteine ligase [Spirillospora sp.]
MLTVGVEEEYLLIDEHSGLPVADSRRVRQAARRMRDPHPDEVQLELLQAQIEIATPVCDTLDQLSDHLRRLRGNVGEAARETGHRLACTGCAPYRTPQPVPVTATERYHAMRDDSRILADEQLICGMHIHLGIPDRDVAVSVLNRMRPWLPLLLALGANSPFWEGNDTGYASWRTLIFGRWPVSGPPPACTGAADYDERVAGLIDARVIPDRSHVYWHARPSEGHPTLEIRVLDVQLHADTAVALAGLTRALATACLTGGAPDRRFDHPEILQGTTWLAARHGLDAELAVPLTDRPRPVRDLTRALIEHLGSRTDDPAWPAVSTEIHRLLDQGNGAQRQRHAVATGDRDHLLRTITAGC